jgi:peptide/nickel transport system substrate-binding protein
MIRLTRRHAISGAAALATASGTAAAQGTPRRGGTLRMSVDQAASIINPLLTRTNPEYLIAELVYSSLTRLSTTMVPEPDLAESWTPNADLTEWTFRLRPNLSFHDGSPCTASDVVATFTAIMDAKTASPGRANVGPIAGVTAPDDRTVVFRLTSPYADLPTSLAYTDAKIVPAKVVASDLASLARTGNGTGPFKLVSYEPDRRIVVARNDSYYDPTRPYLDRVEIVVYPDHTAEASALISGDTDLMAATTASEFERLAAAPGVNALRTPSGQFLNVNMGCDIKPFSDARVRRALALTVDRDAMVGFVADKYGTPGNDTPMNAAYRYYAALPQREANIAEAKKLLTDAGYPNGIDLTLIASDTPSTRAQMGIALKEMAKPSGFRIDLQVMPHAAYLDQVWKKGNFYVGFYNMQATADAIFALLYTSNAAWNETRWNNTAFDSLIVKARGEVDDAKRAQLYADAQKLQHDEVPSIIPAFFDLLAAKRAYVQNYALHPRGAVFRIDHVWLGDGAPKRG